jgi:uncharacterized protein (DUF58 family)
VRPAGWALSLAFFGVFLFAPSRPVQFAALTFALAPVFDAVYLILAGRALKVRRRDLLVRAPRGEAFQVELVVENRGRLPIFGVALTDPTGLIPSNGANRLMLSLRPRERKVVSYEITAGDRGEYRLGPAALRLRALLGPGGARLAAEETCRVIVFPRVGPLAYAPRTGQPMGNLPSRSPADEDLTRQRSIRAYLPGDELKRINWKVSARTGQLATNEYERTLNCPATVLLNLTLEDYGIRRRYEEIEAAIEAAASLAAAAARNGQAIGLVSSGRIRGESDPVRIDRATGIAWPILDALARIEPSALASLPLFSAAGQSLPYRSQAVYIGADPGEAGLALAALIRARGGRLRLVIPGLIREGELRFARSGVTATAAEEWRRA